MCVGVCDAVRREGICRQVVVLVAEVMTGVKGSRWKEVQLNPHHVIPSAPQKKEKKKEKKKKKNPEKKTVEHPPLIILWLRQYFNFFLTLGYVLQGVFNVYSPDRQQTREVHCRFWQPLAVHS